MTTTASVDLQAIGRQAKQAARRLATIGSDAKNRALLAIADALTAHQDEILRANQHDLQAAREAGVTGYIIDRMVLTPERLAAIASDVRDVAALPDPIGQGFEQRTLANGLIIGKVRVPMGVIACIYEARPNVTADVASLCLKAGSASILRGGKDAFHSSSTIARTIARAASEAGMPDDAIQFVESPDRALVAELLTMREYIDLLVPRGGGLIDFVVKNATMPVLIGGVGVCHTYVDASADLEKALAIVDNAKTRRHTICNALDTVLVHRDVAAVYLPRLAARWAEAEVEMRCDPASLEIVSQAEAPNLVANAAAPDDFGKEHLAMVASVKVVDSLDEALDHIYQYGTGHSDAIVTEDYSAAQRFLHEVDTAVVYVNASTQFTDGAQFGLGAEIIDSTQKFHARGPVGLQEITTYKWVVQGTG
ncbi:MAG: glutamate-5-semialdehyde dehydrogenase, partial [Chloroflexi bacterium]|nr:glutamate-5-semialdehyde dehydrogenase [Chloroflexota bacterium]